MNIALPHIQTGLHFSDTSLSWVMNGYMLTFGGLLLLGGRAGDHGMATAFALAATFDVAAFAVIAALLRPRRPAVPGDAAELAAGEKLRTVMLED